MLIHPAPQHSLDWLAARAGVVTASEMDKLLTPEFKVRTGEMRRSYLCQKLAEKWTGGPLPSFATIDMDFGTILEEECLPAYTLEYGAHIERVGLCLRDDRKVGASPDGLLGEDGGIEAKCCRIDTHTKYLLSGAVPKDYLVQVHSAIYVTKRKWWKFVSYHRRMPMLVVHVDRNEEICNIIDECITGFLEELDVAYAKICEINGGPPKHKAAYPPLPRIEPITTELASFDIIP